MAGVWSHYEGIKIIRLYVSSVISGGWAIMLLNGKIVTKGSNINIFDIKCPRATKAVIIVDFFFKGVA